MKNQTSNPILKNQLQKFQQMAKELEADDDPKAFDAKLKALAKAKEKPAKNT